jgi:ribosomal protein S18 acetylase RimI-like enzyme
MEKSRYYEKSGYMTSAAVDWAHRGRGLQKRLIHRRTAFARAQGWDWILTDTSPTNLASANSLIGCGFKLFKPYYKWGVRGSIYFGKKL